MAEGSSGGTAAVTLVNPPFLVSRWAYAGTLSPPLGIAYVAAACRAAGHRVSVIDAVGERPLRTYRVFEDRLLAHGLTPEEIVARIRRDVDVVGLSCMFSAMWPHVREVAARIRAEFPRVAIVLGGEHATAMPEFVLATAPAIDACVLGEGEETIVELVDALGGGRDLSTVAGVAFRAGGGVRLSRRARIRELDAIAPPAWDLVPVESYMAHGLNMGVQRGRSMPVLASRGCPFRCTFCSSPEMWTTRWRARDPDLLLDEIESLMARHRATNFDFYDLTAIVDRKWIVAFCRRILDRKLRFTWQMPSGTRSEALDGEVVGLLGAAGCSNISYSPESGSPALLKRIKKNVKLPHLVESMRQAAAVGLSVKANIVMGLPSETHADIRATLGLIARAAMVGIDDLSIAPFTPYPGSELFSELVAGRRLADVGDEYFLRLSMQNELGTAQSWSDGVSTRALAAYRLFGHALFYALAFLRRPGRLARVARNVYRGTEESVLDKVVRSFVRRQSQWLRRRAA